MTISDNSLEEKSWFQIIAILIACLSAFTGGMLFSWPSPSIPRIVEDKVNYDITLEEASYFTVIPPLGAIISSLLFTKLNDIIGRKNTLLLIALPHVISLSLLATSRSVYLFYLARFISGLADGCLYASLPMYIGEIATPKVRGVWGNFMSFSIYFGQLMINVVGSYTTVVTCACICLVFPAIFTVLLLLMPESPYFYLMKGKEEEARKCLQRLRRRRDVEEELCQLQQDMKRQMSESGTWRDLLAVESNRKAIYAGVFLRTSQQLGGISSFAVYTQYIFAKSGGAVSASTSAIVFMGLCSFLNVCAGLVLDKVGRRRSYFFSVLFCGIILLLESVYFFLEKVSVHVEVVNWIPLVGMIFYMIFYSLGLGIVPTLMLGELFSASVKTKGLTLMMMVYGILISCSTKIFQVLDTNLGLFAPFLFFSLCCFVSSFLVLYFVPETRGKTLEEIQQSLKTPRK